MRIIEVDIKVLFLVQQLLDRVAENCPKESATDLASAQQLLHLQMSMPPDIAARLKKGE